MIILDTSIWIEFFKKNESIKPTVENLLRERQIIAFDFIFGELLQGARENEKSKIIGLWEILPKINISGIGFYAGKYALENKCYDKGVGLIDCAIIYATISSESKLWTLDKKVLGVIDKQFQYKF
jgi:predicted nucleic acid-binding protein